jgi:hypothetical protein
MKFLELIYTLAFLISAHAVINMDKIRAYVKRPEESMLEKKSNTTHRIRTQKMENTNKKIRGMEKSPQTKFSCSRAYRSKLTYTIST